MAPMRVRLAIVVVLLACSSLLLAYPVEPVLTTHVIFDDEVDKRIKEETIGDTSRSQLILRFRHDDGEMLTNNLTRVQRLMQLEQEALTSSNSSIALDAGELEFKRIESPFKIWEEAFASRNRSLSNATNMTVIMEPLIENGWCGEGSTEEEQTAFETTLLLLPTETNYGVACPAFAGASASQLPAANEVLWLVWIDDGESNTDWGELSSWAQQISDVTEFEVSAIGVNMMFAKSKSIAEDDLKFILIPSLLLLVIILAFALRNPTIAAATLGGVGLVICAEAGFLSALGHEFSILDGIALPIIMGVAVDGAFWYCKSSRTRDEVRKMLFLAMVTTVGAVSLALFSPIRAQRSLALIMIIGIILDWIVTRFVLEEFYLRNRNNMRVGAISKPLTSNISMQWCWPVVLILLASVAVIAPVEVDLLDLRKMVPENDPTIEEMDELKTKYVLAASTIAWVIVDVDGDSSEDLEQVQNLQRQLGQHPSVIALDTGFFLSPMVIGVPDVNTDFTNPTIDGISTSTNGSILVDDARLQRNGVTTGVAIAVLIDGENSGAALDFSDDVIELLDINGLSGEVGGDLPVGAALAHAFEENRVNQILAAGSAVFVVSLIVLRSPSRAIRIAIGTIAIGAAVDGMASIMGDRGVSTAPAVLLGMGFAADYLSHASADHAPTRDDTYARWGAAVTSVSVFILLGLANFPPARSAGNLLTFSILFSAILATCLSLTKLPQSNNLSEE